MINKSSLQILAPPLIAIWKFLLVGKGSVGMLSLNRAERFRNSDAQCYVYLRTFVVRLQLKKCFSKIVYHFFFLLFDCPMANSGPFSREKPHSLILITAFWTILTQRSPGTSWWGWIPKHSWVLSGTWTGSFPEDFLTEGLLRKNFCLQCFVPFKRMFVECMIHYMNVHHIFSSLP